MTPATSLPAEPEPAPEPATLYWAKRDGAELATAVNSKQKEFFDAIERRGMRSIWQLAWAQNYGQDPSSAGTFETQQIGFTGEEGEQLVFRVNEARSFSRQQITMATSQRPAFKCVALNTDYSSISQIDASDTVISYFYQQEMGEEKERDVTESDNLFGAGFGWMRWDKDGGDEVEVTEPVIDPATGQQAMQPMPHPSGDVVPMPATQKVKKQSGAPVGQVLYPWEVVRDHSRARDHLWCTVRERCSKAELAAEYPDHAQDIDAIKTLDEYCVENLFGFDAEAVTDDDVIVKHFYHARCRAIPDGRYVGMVGTVILWDLPIPVPKGLPVREMCSARFIASAFGYGEFWDLLAINQAIDQMNSDALTNFATFGRQVVVVDEGTDYDVDALANGQRVLTKLRDTDMPQPINFAAMPEGAFRYLDYLHARMQSISGLNSVARGTPDASVKSGQHAALFHSIAIEFQHARQAALDDFRKGMANLMLDLIRMNADQPFLIEVAGEDERPYLKEFDKQAIAGVRRVTVETSNPMMRSQAGRLELFNAVGQLPTPEAKSAAISLITTGQAKQFTKKNNACDMRIKWENEQLAKGIPCQVGALDNPFKHVPEHWADIESRSAQLNNPDLTPQEQAENAKILSVQLEHIKEHLPAWLSLDPMLAAFNQIPPPPPPPMRPPPGMRPANDNARGGQPAANDNGKPPEAMKGPAAEQEPAAGIALPKPAGPPPNAQVAPGGKPQ